MHHAHSEVITNDCFISLRRASKLGCLGLKARGSQARLHQEPVESLLKSTGPLLDIELRTITAGVPGYLAALKLRHVVAFEPLQAE